jgi:hypothetical protein
MIEETVYFRGLPVGKIQDGTTYVIKKRPEHFMRMFHGFGISLEVLNELSLKGVKDIKMIYYGVNGILLHEFKLKEYLDSPLGREDANHDYQKFVDIDKSIITKITEANLGKFSYLGI